MADLKTLVEEIIKELKRIERLSIEEVTKEWNTPFPSIISRGDGHGIIISPKIDKNISEIAKIKSSNNPTLANAYKKTELHKLLQNTLGLTLAKIDVHSNVNNNVEAIIKNIQDALANQISSHSDREYVFGCTLFSNVDVSAFSIGPVTFEPRIAWLDRKKSSQELSDICYRRIKNKWQGKNVKKRKKTSDEAKERAVIDAVGSYPYICSVYTQGLPSETGEEKALIAARLALTSISLLWQTPSKALDGFNLSYDRRFYLKKSLSFSQGKMRGLGAKVSQMPHGPHITPKNWEAQYKKYQVIFSICGEICAYILNPRGQSPRQKIMNTLAQALIWYHAASREQDNLISIVKYAACLDTLACGGESNGIRKLINKQLGIADNASVFKDGPSMMKSVKEIYSVGRSRTIHGTNDKLGHDWSTTRTEAECLARACFLSCVDWAGQNPSIDDPLEFST